MFAKPELHVSHWFVSSFPIVPSSQSDFSGLQTVLAIFVHPELQDVHCLVPESPKKPIPHSVAITHAVCDVLA